MTFEFEITLKNGKVQKVRIKAKIESDAIRELRKLYRDIKSFRLIS